MDKESDVGSSEPGSGRDTPRSIDQDCYQSYTPGCLPTYQYSKEDLYDLEKAPASRLIPNCLDKDFIVDNVWDPERWFRSFSGGGSAGGSRGPSPLTQGEPFRERRGERRHSASERSSDPKERLKEERDGIILSPQRRSFGTGCHVSHQQPLLQRALSNIGDGERREQRRIGSGRIQIDRERGSEREYARSERDRGGERGDSRDFRNERSERGSERDRDRDFRNERIPERDSRDYRNVREIDRGGERERDGREFRNSRDRFERDDRDRERRYDRDRMFISRRDLDERARERDFRDFSGRQNSRHDRRHHKEEEPEWFNSGPISKSDMIELHGFEREKAKPKTEHNRRSKENRVSEHEEEYHDDKTDEPETTGISVSDRNGSLETNESSSPETNQSDLEPRRTKTPPSNTLFDFNEFFKIENLPGIADDPVADTELTNIGGSRFYQLYRMSESGGNQNWGAGSKENSRRSSVIEDEFGYLNDLLNGSKSPVIPSPPPPSANTQYDQSVFFTPGTSRPSGNNPFVTALMNNAASLEKNQRSPPVVKNSPQETEAKLKAILFGRIDSTSSSGNTTPGFNSPLNVPGKVKTLAELEGELQPQNNKPMPAHIRTMTPPTAPQHRSSPGSDSDLSAFNKLISLMQAGAARPVESPKLPIKMEQRPSSPLVTMPSNIPQGQMPHVPHPQPPKVIHKPEPLPVQQNSRPVSSDIQFGSVDSFPAHLSTPTSVAQPHQDPLSEANAAQKQFLQALQRNKEQQLQIRQVAIQNMRMHQPQPGAQPIQMAPPPLQQQPQQQQQQQQAMPSQPNSSQQQPVVQPVRRLSTGDPIMNFVKANPTIITKPASPTPPPTQPPQPLMNIVASGTTPRGPSPSPILQSALLSQQQPGSPRVPSPIMFSQQPPMHLSAPSPIHPSQGGPIAQSPTGQPATTNTTNTIRPPSVPRVPSPQELIAHTQAILQNALIKKQLEDQKERFYKKQQERGKSPNLVLAKPMEPGKSLECLIGSSGSTVTPLPILSTPVASKPTVNVAFTPTSVIRKMHSEKANEKEKQRRDSMDAEAQDKQLTDIRDRQGSMVTEGGDQLQISTTSTPGSSSRTDQQATAATIPPPSVMHAIPPPPLPNQVLPNMLSVMPGTVLPGLPPFNTNQLTHLPPPPPHVSTHLPPPLLSPGGLPPPPPPPTTSLEQMDAKSQHLRQLIGQQLPVVSTVSAPGRPIVKGIPPSSQPIVTSMDLAALQQQQHQQQRPIIGSTASPAVSGVDMAKLLQQQRQYSASPSMMSRAPATPTTPYGIPIAGRVPVHSTPILGPQVPTSGSNPILMQQMIQGGNPRSMNQLTQLASLQAQQRVLDPRGVRPPIAGTMVPQMLSPRSIGAVQSTMPNSALNSHFNPHTLTPLVNPMKNGPISPVSLPLSMVTNGSNNFSKQENVNFVKWFGHDMLKNQLPTMPPLPVQGQKVLTLDEIERI